MPASPRLESDVIKLLGLAHGDQLYTRVTSVAIAEAQWHALLEITARQTSKGVAPQVSHQSLLLQVISAQPLHIGQLVILLFNKNNRLEVLRTPIEPASFNRTTNSAGATPYKEHNNTLTTASVFQKFLETTPSSNTEVILKLLQQLPRSISLPQQTALLKTWIGQQASIQKLTTHPPVTNTTNDEAINKVTSVDKPAKQSTENIAANKLEETIENILRTMIGKKSSPDRTGQEIRHPFVYNKNTRAVSNGNTLNNAENIIVLIKKILTEHGKSVMAIDHTNIKNAHNSNLEKDNELMSALKSLSDRLMQLQSSHQANKTGASDTSQTFKCDIPLWHKEGENPDSLRNVQLMLEREQPKSAGKSHGKKQLRWRIVLDFDLESFGEVQAEALVREKQVNIALWAEKKTTQKLIENRIPDFSKKLIAKGIPLEGLHCRHEKPTKNRASKIYTLLDVRG